MRIHTSAALYVFAFSFFFHLSGTDYAVLALTFAAVLMAELFNTAAEGLCDMVSPAFSPSARAVKDMASGGVLVGAFFSVCVAVDLFRQPEAFRRMADYFACRPAMIAVLAASAAADIVFIALGPLGIRDLFERIGEERKKRHEGK